MKRSSRNSRPQSHTLRLLDTDIEIINKHSAVRTAHRKLQKAIEKMTHWRLAVRGGVPKGKFHLLVEYEDALGALKQALIQATHERVLQKLMNLCATTGVRLGASLQNER